MKLVKDKIEEIKTNGYQIDFGTVFEHAFENYKKIALYAGLMLMVFLILFAILIFGAAISVFGMATITETLKPENLQPEHFSLNFLIIYTAGTTLFTCLISPFTAGFLKMADCAEKGNEFHVSTILEYYKFPFFKEIFLATFLITIMSSVLNVLLDYSGIKFVGTFIAIGISFLTFLAVPLIVFGNLKAVEAIKSSILLVSKQPLLLFGLLIVGGIASMTGLILLCIGIFFTIPFMYSMNYAIYDSIIGVDQIEAEETTDTLS